ncbi:hypothetical protein [Clostridium tetani]|uniref:hypothetical protein n=1 Tax=Clostridium tetani TaxID=1513 RepID=UPI001009E669|nr:hypothetical protein [Clostridium tetani]RXI64464.1 hypothetical protein DP132_01215 [Clostridium tetani]RXI67095.1 hypothetical protein DP121_13400 [Clostridium tetani]RXM54086.1 hypothetical protein DP134_13150 [Clostridium tetani]
MNKLIMDTLKPLKIPVSFQRYTGRKDTYITFHEYFTGGEEYEDDNEVLTAHYVQVDIWSKTDYTNIVKEVKEKLVSVGFKRLNEADLYEKDTRIYHKGMRFYYLEER